MSRENLSCDMCRKKLSWSKSYTILKGGFFLEICYNCMNEITEERKRQRRERREQARNSLVWCPKCKTYQHSISPCMKCEKEGL